MDFKTTSPNAKPTNVATAYPNTPTNIPGTTNEDHFKEAAIAAAVVGPPTLALLATSASERRKRKSFAAKRRKVKWVSTWVAEKKKRDGAVDNMSAMEPEAPTVEKKAFMANAAKASPDCATSLHCLGKAVATRTENTVAIGMVNDAEPLFMSIDNDLER